MSFPNPVSAKRYSAKKSVKIWVKGSWTNATLRYRFRKLCVSIGGINVFIPPIETQTDKKILSTKYFFYRPP